MAETLTFFHASPREYESSILAKGILASSAERYKVIEKDILGVFGVVNMEEARETLGRNTLIKLDKVLDGVASRFSATSDVIYLAGDWSYAVQNCLGGYEVYDQISTWFPKRKLPQEPVGKFPQAHLRYGALDAPSIPPPSTLAETRAIGDKLKEWPVCTLFVVELPVSELWKPSTSPSFGNNSDRMKKVDELTYRTLSGEEYAVSMFNDFSSSSQHEVYAHLPYPERVRNVWKAEVFEQVRLERNRIPKSWIKDHFPVPWFNVVTWGHSE